MAMTRPLVLLLSLALASCSKKPATPPPASPPAPTPEAVALPPPEPLEEDADSAPRVATLPPVAFKDHPAPLFTGPLTKPDIAGGGASARMYPTRIRAAAAAGVQFGGKYGVMISGCGTSCLFGFVIDETNGRVTSLPVGEEGHYQLQLAFRPDSRWMRALWNPGTELEACALQDFVIEKGAFRSVRTERLPGVCPVMDTATGASSGEPF